MFLSRNKKNNVYPSKPQFYYIKVGFKGVKIIWACFRDGKQKIYHWNYQYVIQIEQAFVCRQVDVRVEINCLVWYIKILYRSGSTFCDFPRIFCFCSLFCLFCFFFVFFLFVFLFVFVCLFVFCFWVFFIVCLLFFFIVFFFVCFFFVCLLFLGFFLLLLFFFFFCSVSLKLTTVYHVPGSKTINISYPLK